MYLRNLKKYINCNIILQFPVDLTRNFAYNKDNLKCSIIPIILNLQLLEKGFLYCLMDVKPPDEDPCRGRQKL